MGTAATLAGDTGGVCNACAVGFGWVEGFNWGFAEGDAVSPEDGACGGMTAAGEAGGGDESGEGFKVGDALGGAF